MLENFISFVAKHLVEHPEDVSVILEEEDKADNYTLLVPKHDIGRVIGKDGRNAKALRTLLSSASSIRDRHSKLRIVEDDKLDE